MLFKVVGGLLVGAGMVFLLNVGRFPRRYHAKRVRRHAEALRAAAARPGRRPPSSLGVGTWPFPAVRFGLGAGLLAAGVGTLMLAAAR